MLEFLTQVKKRITQFVFENSAFKFENLHYVVRYLVYAWISFFVILSIVMLSPNILFYLAIGFVIQYYVCAIFCWQLAYNKDRNTDFAFVWGFFTTIFGAGLYWLYTIFRKKNPVNWESDTTKAI